MKGQEKISTLPGALITILTYIFLLYVAALSFLQMVSYENNKIQSYDMEMSRSAIADYTANMHDQDIDIAFTLINTLTGTWHLP